MVGLTEDRMHPVQLRQTKQAFFGAAGQVLIYLRDDLGAKDNETAVDGMQAMLDEVGDFWLKQKNETN